MKPTATAIAFTVTAFGFGASTASADFMYDVIGGQTSVLLDTDLLAAAAGLNLSGISDDVIVPGDLGEGSVAFAINPIDGMPPTTFSYNDGLVDFAGTIEHTGSVFFNDDSIEVGNFRIGFDPDFVGDLTSGFFVESTVGTKAILFDVGIPESLTADETGLMIQADLLVSSGFAQFLLDAGLADQDLTGAVVGSALVAGVIPAPGAIALLAVAGLMGHGRRRP